VTVPAPQAPDSGAILPEQSGDDTDRGWGERPPEADPDDLERFLADRPPHHGSV